VPNEMSASKFKAECLAVLDDVASSGREVVVTKRGRPVARVVPMGPRSSRFGVMKGTARILVDTDEFLSPLDEWDAER